MTPVCSVPFQPGMMSGDGFSQLGCKTDRKAYGRDGRCTRYDERTGNGTGKTFI
jgi:hypothetical protein